MDVLSEVLNSLHLRSGVYCRVELRGAWSLHFARTRYASFHVIEQGECWLAVQGHEPLALQSGDLIVLSQGAEHTLASDLCIPSMVTIYLGKDVDTAYRCEAYGADGPATALICGTFDLDEQQYQPLLSLMPPLLLVRSSQNRSNKWLEPTLRFFAAEATSAQPGMQTMLRRLADMLFIQVVRFWVNESTQPVQGWLGALRDQQISQALGLIHGSLEKNWSVLELATTVGMSRSAFSARFSELIGQSPIQYLTRWRMQTAARLLSEARLQMNDVAARVGYDSEAAFSKAFKREMGINPSVYRQSGVRD